MRIVERSPDRLLLAGKPGGVAGMLGFTGFGAVLSVVLMAVLARAWGSASPAAFVPLGAGLLLGQAMFWIGLLTLLLGHERLELDQRTGRGRYVVRSPILRPPQPSTAFDLGEVHSVSFELRVVTERAERKRDVEHATARLRLAGPRRAIVLAESQNADDRPVRAVASEMAAFLGVDLVDAVAADEQRTPAALVGVSLQGRPRSQSLAFEPQPEPPEWEVDREPSRGLVRFTELRPGAPRVVGCFLLIGTFLAVISGTIAAAAWLPGQTMNGRPMRDLERLLISVPCAALPIATAWAWLAAVRGRRQITVDASLVRIRWVFPGRGLLAFALDPMALRNPGRTAVTAEVESVRVVRSANGPVVEVRSPAARARVGSGLLDEAAERGSLGWLAGAIEEAVRAMG